MKMNVTESATMKDIYTLGHKVDKRTKTVYCVNDGRTWLSAKACAEDLGVSYQNVKAACSGLHKTCKGLTLCYEEDVHKLRTEQTKTIQSYARQCKRIAELETKAHAYDAQEAQKKKESNTHSELHERISRRFHLQERDYETWQKRLARMNESVTELFDMCNHQATFVTELNPVHTHIKVNDHVFYDMEDKEFYFTL